MEMMAIKIRTKAWMHYIAIKVGVDVASPSALEKKTGQPKQYWHRYRNGNPPSETIRYLVEQKIPGSLDIFSIGPDRSPLWTALWSINEQELSRASRTTSGIIQFHQAWNSNREYLCDYTNIESTKIYFAALSEYYEEMISASNGLIDMEDLTALIAAFRLGQFQKEAANHQKILGHCLKSSLAEDSYTLTILRDYGILDYIANYIDKLIPHSEKHSQVIPLISRENAFNSYWIDS